MFRSTLASSSAAQTSITAFTDGDVYKNQSGAPGIKKTRSLREAITASVGNLFDSGKTGKKERHLSEPIPRSIFSAIALKQRASAPATLNTDEVNPDSHLLRMIQQACYMSDTQGSLTKPTRRTGD
ncbi:hypothetical protein QCA50_016570 [Cerrena zonata]|uniref:Uncharacterized protein n=1 Tax=Cerrena zonata TaxID=2478898 RepID=A0AAW0FMU7_9APHY